MSARFVSFPARCNVVSSAAAFSSINAIQNTAEFLLLGNFLAGATVCIVVDRKIERKGETTMKRYLPVFTALAMSLMSSAFVPSLRAGVEDQKTIITISQPVAVQGKVLPAGRYVLKLQNSSSSRNVVTIFNDEETRVLITVLAIHAYRLQPTDKTAFSFYGSSAGQPAALHEWFYPGEESGFEFLNLQHQVAADPGAVGH
jgi:hypothetical protein